KLDTERTGKVRGPKSTSVGGVHHLAEAGLERDKGPVGHLKSEPQPRSRQQRLGRVPEPGLGRVKPTRLEGYVVEEAAGGPVGEIAANRGDGQRRSRVLIGLLDASHLQARNSQHQIA